MLIFIDVSLIYSSFISTYQIKIMNACRCRLCNIASGKSLDIKTLLALQYVRERGIKLVSSTESWKYLYEM